MYQDRLSTILFEALDAGFGEYCQTLLITPITNRKERNGNYPRCSGRSRLLRNYSVHGPK